MGRIQIVLFVWWWWWWWWWWWRWRWRWWWWWWWWWWERRAETTHLKWCSCQFTSSFSNAGTRASARRLAVPPCLPWLLPRSVCNLKDLGTDDYLQDAMNPYFKGIWRWELYVSSIWWLGVPRAHGGPCNFPEVYKTDWATGASKSPMRVPVARRFLQRTCDSRPIQRWTPSLKTNYRIWKWAET